MMNRRVFLIASALVGLEPFALCWILPGSVHTALLSPLLLAALTYIFLRDLNLGQQVRWTAASAAVATVAFAVPIALSGPIALAVFPAPFWFPWLFIFAMPPLLFRRWALRMPFVFRPLLAVSLGTVVYLISGLLCLEFWTRTVPTDVEHPDARGRLPALGPGVSPVGRLVCPPRGPSFLWSVDYAGGEWMWTVYRPVIRLWFSLPITPYFHPYDKSA